MSMFHSVAGKTQKVAQVLRDNEDAYYISQSKFIQIEKVKLMDFYNKITEQTKEMTKYTNSLTQEMEGMKMYAEKQKDLFNRFKENFDNQLEEYFEMAGEPLYSKFADVRDLNKEKGKIKSKINDRAHALFHFNIENLGIDMTAKLVHRVNQMRTTNDAKIDTFNNLMEVIHTIVILLEEEKTNIKALEQAINNFYTYIERDDVKEYFLDIYLQFKAQEIRSYKVKELNYYKIYTRRMKQLKKMWDFGPFPDFHKVLDYLNLVNACVDKINTARTNYQWGCKTALDAIRKFRTGYYDKKTNSFQLKPFYNKTEETEIAKWNKLMKDADFNEISNILEEYKEMDYYFKTFTEDITYETKDIKRMKNNERSGKYYNLLIDTKLINEDAVKRIENEAKKQFNNLMENYGVKPATHFLKIRRDEIVLAEDEGFFNIFGGESMKEKHIMEFITNCFNKMYSTISQALKTCYVVAYVEFEKRKKQVKETIDTILTKKETKPAEPAEPAEEGDETEDDDNESIETDYDNTNDGELTDIEEEEIENAD